MIGAVLTFCCGFCKGPQGLFLLSIIPLYYLFFGFSMKKASTFGEFLKWAPYKCTFVHILIVACLYALPLLFHQGRVAMQEYIDTRLSNTFTHTAENQGHSRLYIIQTLLQEIVIPFGFAAVMLIVHRVRKKEWGFSARQLKWFGFTFCIGLSGSLPLMVTYEQRGFYLVPAYAYFALAATFLVIPVFNQFKSTKIKKVVAGLAGITMIAVSCFLMGYRYNSCTRDEELLNFVWALKKNEIPSGRLSIDDELQSIFNLHQYIVRYNDWELPFSEDSTYVIANPSMYQVEGEEVMRVGDWKVLKTK